MRAEAEQESYNILKNWIMNLDIHINNILTKNSCKWQNNRITTSFHITVWKVWFGQQGHKFSNATQDFLHRTLTCCNSEFRTRSLEFRTWTLLRKLNTDLVLSPKMNYCLMV